MHIPGNLLAGHVEAVTNSVSAVAIAGTAYYAVKSENKPTAARFAAVASLIFALQMMNFPVQDGTSGHLIGAVLAVFLLGAPFGILAMAGVLAVQSLVFADGGVGALGANILNMAIVGGLAGAGVKILNQKGLSKYPLMAVGAWLSVIAASFVCSIELAFSGVVDFYTVAAAMILTHVLIGAGEAVLTVAAFVLIGSGKKVKSKKLSVWLPVGTAIFTGLLLSPFASGFPDGLEWVAGKLGFASLGMPQFVTPFADYTFPGVNFEFLSTGLAGLTGVIVTFTVVYLAGRILTLNLEGND